MIRKVLVYLIFFSSYTTRAQDYAVTSQNDTLRGKIMIMDYDIHDRVEIKEGKKTTHLTAIQVKALVLKNEIYNPVRTEKGFRLMKLITPGYVSLYHQRGPSGKYDTQILVLRTGESTEVPGIMFKKTMSNFLRECTSIEEIIEKKNLTRKNIDQIIREFNSCIEEQTKQVPAKPTVSEQDPLVAAITDLKNKVELNPSLASKKDVIDLLNDIREKVKNNQKVANYLSGSLKDYLKDIPEYQADVDKIIELLKTR